MTQRRTRPTTLRAAIGTILLLSLSATACAGSDSEGDTGAAKLTDNDIPSLTIALPSPPPSYDRATSTQPIVTGSFMSLVTEPLERVTANGGFTLALAEKVTQPDPTTIVYKLRSGVRFSDGRPLTAEDVAWSITHTATPPAQTSASVSGFKSAAVTGPLEVTVKLAGPLPKSRVDIAGATLIQEKKFATAHAKNLGTPDAIPIGTGPYEIASASASGVTLQRRGTYWGEKPKMKTLNVKVITDDNSAQLAMRSGEVNLRQLTNVKTAAQWRSIPGTRVYASPSGVVNFLAMDVTKAPFDDVHVRRAISHATDTPGLVKAAWAGQAAVLKGFVPVENLARVAGGKQNAQKFLDSLPDHALDLEKAKAELAQSGHPKGFSTTVEYVDALPASKVLALSLQQNLKPLGISITPKSVTLNAWSAKFYQHKLTGLVPAFGFSTSAQDPSSLLSLVVGKENIGPQKLNIANFTTPEIEKALPAVTTAGADAKRWAATQTLLSQIADQAPYVPLASEKSMVAIGKGFASASGTIVLNDLFNGNWALNLRATQQ
ncbi:ABC transporter substrate-binding protein [Streptomyces sp. NPDC021218]|uniref:ABC transporter substrate-binding protein n=1 Tax=unclassified Streptomyces TaxID=2593676 RepID=UPI0036784EB1